MNHSEIRYLIRSKVNGSNPYNGAKIGQFYRKGSGARDPNRGWHNSPLDATLFTKEELKHINRLYHGLTSDQVEVVEVDVTVTDFPSERKGNE